MRVNCSHATKEEIDMRIENLANAEKGPLHPHRAVLFDTKGPEIRTGNLSTGSDEVEGKRVMLEAGDEMIVTTDDQFKDACTKEKMWVSYADLCDTVSPGDQILFDDGLVALTVTEVINGTDVRCTVADGAELGDRKGVNLPGLEVNLPAMSDKDRADIMYGIECDMDILAASFVRTADQVKEIKDWMEHCISELGKDAGRDTPWPRPLVISKIENAEAMDNFDEILEASEGIMVARGDLGVEIPYEKVATAQKRMVRACNQAGKPVIVATQMLETMQKNPRPTRAEVSDVANAVLEGADCVMLSGESAKGAYFRESIETMANIVREADVHHEYESWSQPDTNNLGPYDGMAKAAVDAADDFNADAIIVLTKTGRFARMVSKWRPDCPIVAFCWDPAVARQLVINRGVYPMVGDRVPVHERPLSTIQQAMQAGFCKSGDRVVLVGGRDPTDNMEMSQFIKTTVLK